MDRVQFYAPKAAALKSALNQSREEESFTIFIVAMNTTTTKWRDKSTTLTQFDQTGMKIAQTRTGAFCRSFYIVHYEDELQFNPF